MPPTKRPIMEGSDDGEGYRWKTLKAKDGAIDVFYGHGSASRFQLKKADKKTAPTEQLVLQRIAEHRDAKRKQQDTQILRPHSQLQHPRQPQKALDRARRQMNTKNNGKTQKHHHHHSARSRPAQFCLESHPGIRWSGEHRTITADGRKHDPNEPHGDPNF